MGHGVDTDWKRPAFLIGVAGTSPAMTISHDRPHDRNAL
jgi:hypothetical protein